MKVSRRTFLKTGAAAAALLGCGGDGTSGAIDGAVVAPDADPLAPDADPSAPDGTAFTPCDPETSSDIEGPFYRAGAPENAVLVDPADEGVRLLLTGKVLAPMGGMCLALAGATLDVWHADNAGAYDNVGYKFRGILSTDAEGNYRLETIIPGRYLNGAQYRPAHIHVKAQGAGTELLTTQLYFEGDPFNASDPWFQESLMLLLADDGAGGKTSTFDFVLRPA